MKPDCSDANLKNYRGYWRIFTEWLAEQPEKPLLMRDVTETLAKRYANYLDALPVSGNTFNKHRAFLLSFFKVLTGKTKAESNLFSVIGRKLKVKAAKKRDLNADELRAVLSNATGEMGLLLWIGATTGLRLGDAVTLTWGDVDLSRGDTGKRAVTEVGIHSLRHSFATICGDTGTAESVTRKLLGHSRAAMTHYYQHATERAAMDTAKRLDGAFRGLIGETTEPAPEEPERAELRALADTLPVETIRAILAGIREK